MLEAKGERKKGKSAAGENAVIIAQLNTFAWEDTSTIKFVSLRAEWMKIQEKTSKHQDLKFKIRFVEIRWLIIYTLLKD